MYADEAVPQRLVLQDLAAQRQEISVVRQQPEQVDAQLPRVTADAVVPPKKDVLRRIRNQIGDMHQSDMVGPPKERILDHVFDLERMIE